MALDFSGKTFDTLQQEFVALGDKLSVLNGQRGEYVAEIERRQRDVAARAKLDAMTDDEKLTLKTVLDADPAVSAVIFANALAAKAAL